MSALDLAPLVVPWVLGAILAPLDGRRRGTAWIAVAGLAVVVAGLARLTLAVAADGPLELVTGGWPAGLGIRLRADLLGALFALVSAVVLLAALLHEVLVGVHERTLPALFLVLTAGLTGLFLTGDAFNFYVFFEVAMMASFVLASYGRRQREVRAALIFTVVNLFGSVLFLAGIAGLYHLTGSLDMPIIAARAATSAPVEVLVVGALLFVAFSIKLGLFPFHFWLPPIYRDAWPAVAAVLSGAVANIGAYGLVRFGVDILPGALAVGSPVLLVVGGVSILYGAHQAVSVRTTSETLAYSAIGQAGYVLVGLAIGGPVAAAAAVVYAVLNALTKGLLFLAAPLRGEVVAVAYLVGALSVAGVPPAAGFFGKAALIRAGIAAEALVPVGLVVVGALLSFVYMFQSHQRAFWRTPPAAPAPAGARTLVAALAGLVLAVGLWPAPLLGLADRAVRALGGNPS
jgi:multicomponent Na+:H+ antiporter subunit D